MTLELTSTDLAHGGEILSKYTCDGQDVSPPLAWSGVPAEAPAHFRKEQDSYPRARSRA